MDYQIDDSEYDSGARMLGLVILLLLASALALGAGLLVGSKIERRHHARQHVCIERP